MRPSRFLALIAFLGFATPAAAQDGTPWGSTTDDEGAEEAAEPAEEAGEDEGDEDADETSEESSDEDDGRTVSAKRGGGDDQEEEASDGLPMAEPGTAIARIQVEADSLTSPPGGEVEFVVIFWDADDKAIPEVEFDLLAKSGEVGEVVEEGGRYTTTLTVSRYAEDEAKLSVVSSDGQHEMVKIEVEGDPVEASDDEEEDAVAEAEEEPEAEPKPPKEKKPKTTRDPVWLHLSARGAGGMYAYSQTPEENAGPLIEDTLQFGGEAGAPATAAGADLSATWWADDLDLEYFGVQGDLRMMGYSVASGAFEGAASDLLFDGGVYALGRVPIEVGDARVWGGGRLGFHYDDFLIFEGCLVGGCRVDFATVSMPGLGIGPRGGLAIGDLMAELGYTAALGRFTQPYYNAIDLSVGYIVYDPLTVELGFDQVNRTIALEGKDSGDIRGRIKDSQTVVGLGVGAVF